MKVGKEPERYGDDVERRWKELKDCCRRECYKMVSENDLKNHLADIEFFRSLGHRAFKGWVRTIYFTLLPFVPVKNKKEKERGSRICNFSVPAIDRQFCRDAFTALLGLNKSTLVEIVTTPPLTATPNSHGNTGRKPSNTLSENERNSVISFITQIAEREGVPNPRFALDRTSSDGPEDFLNIIHLPPSYTTNSLYIRYSKSSDQATVKRSSFKSLLKTEESLQHIKLSKRTRGMCEVCKSLRLSLQRASSDERAVTLMESLRTHLQYAHDLRIVYKERIELASLKWTENMRSGGYERLSVAAISFDYATQLSLPVSAFETQGEYIASQFGLDVNLFGIVDEGEKKYYNYLYTEGYKHGSEHVISMVHAHLRDYPISGNAELVNNR